MNPVAARKRQSAYAKYMASAEWKRKRDACIKAAGGRCVYWIGYSHHPMILDDRCANPATCAHHKTYRRFGGAELPQDLQALCRDHHDYLHAILAIPPRFLRSRKVA